VEQSSQRREAQYRRSTVTDSLIYFAIISVAFCIALVWFARRAEQRDLSQRTAMDIALGLMIGGFVGARAFHIFYEAPALYFAHPSQIYRVWEGGFVWYGGAIVGALCGIAIAIRKKESVRKWLDVSAPVVGMGYALGRVACWYTGCCYGRYCDLGQTHFQFPTQLFAVTWESLVVIYLLRRETRVKEPSGSLFATYLILHGLGRVIMELFRADDRGPSLGPITVSIFISLVLIGFGFVWRRSLKT
jgi:phosphatidylglycerol:prolipoprotein diacylglycerol transferase